MRRSKRSEFGRAEACGDPRPPVSDRGLRPRAALLSRRALTEALYAEFGVMRLARRDLAEDFGERSIGDPRELFELHADRLAHEHIHDHRIDPAFERIVEHREPHVAALPGRPDVGVAGEARRPGVVHRVALGVRAERLHDFEHAIGVIGLFEHYARGGHALLDARRRVDRVGETRRAGEFAVDERRHQPHEFAAVARRRVGRRGQKAALGEVGLDRHRIAHRRLSSGGHWS